MTRLRWLLPLVFATACGLAAMAAAGAFDLHMEW